MQNTQRLTSLYVRFKARRASLRHFCRIPRKDSDTASAASFREKETASPRRRTIAVLSCREPRSQQFSRTMIKCSRPWTNIATVRIRSAQYCTRRIPTTSEQRDVLQTVRNPLLEHAEWLSRQSQKTHTSKSVCYRKSRSAHCRVVARVARTGRPCPALVLLRVGGCLSVRECPGDGGGCLLGTGL